MRKVVVYVPVSHAEAVRKTIGESGGGNIGNYSHVTFSSEGTARFVPGEGSNPAIGEVGKMQAVDEEKIEFVCDGPTCDIIIDAVKKVHPYEEPTIDIWDIDLA